VKHFGWALGFYKWWGGVAADDKGKLKLTLREQIDAQHPNFVDC
jgi:hypothetical protein